MERLLMFGLAGWTLSCPGPSWRSEVSETASDFYTLCPCLGKGGEGGLRKNLYLTWNLHSKPQTYSSLSSTREQ